MPKEKSHTAKSDESSGEDTIAMSAYAPQMQHAPLAQRAIEGLTVIGEAVRRVQPETAEFLIEITSTAPTAAHALREVHARVAQVAQAAASVGVQQSDLHSISLNVNNAWTQLGQNWNNLAPVYSAISQPLPAYAGVPSALSAAFAGSVPQQPLSQGAGFMPFAQGAGMQPDLQFGQWTAKNALRVTVREAGRVGDVIDSMVRAGATILGAFTFRPSDEAHARRSALESAAKDARAKAEALAAASGKQIGDPIAVSEDVASSNGLYAGQRAGIPNVTGELEYYARVSATFRLQ